MPEPLLTVRDLEAWYGESHILHGVDLEVRTGEVVTLLGRNGAGKTTTLKSVMGIVERRRGSVRFGAAELIRLPSNLIARLGLAFCPEERGIFASLSVEGRRPSLRDGARARRRHDPEQSARVPHGHAARVPRGLGPVGTDP